MTPVSATFTPWACAPQERQQEGPLLGALLQMLATTTHIQSYTTEPLPVLMPMAGSVSNHYSVRSNADLRQYCLVWHHTKTAASYWHYTVHRAHDGCIRCAELLYIHCSCFCCNSAWPTARPRATRHSVHSASDLTNSKLAAAQLTNFAQICHNTAQTTPPDCIHLCVQHQCTPNRGEHQAGSMLLFSRLRQTLMTMQPANQTYAAPHSSYD
jgi:hypothetical protein